MGKKSKQKQFRKVNNPNLSSKGIGGGADLRPVNSNSSAILGGKLAATGPVKLDLFSDYSYVRRDIQKIVLLILGLTILLGVAVTINLKTDWLIRAGSSISSFLEL